MPREAESTERGDEIKRCSDSASALKYGVPRRHAKIHVFKKLPSAQSVKNVHSEVTTNKRVAKGKEETEPKHKEGISIVEPRSEGLPFSSKKVPSERISTPGEDKRARTPNMKKTAVRRRKKHNDERHKEPSVRRRHVEPKISPDVRSTFTFAQPHF